MSHRGPDDKGIWISEDRKVCLAHRRLSIVDLSSNGHQPMNSHDGKLTIVFNGEIYNHRDLKTILISKGHEFYTNSDTEVILKAYREWGNGCISYLNGMFAFSIYDKEKNLVFIARDRAGEKPLFYLLNENGLAFSSELKGLFELEGLDRKINPEALDCYLSFGFVPGDLCIIEKVKKLPAAHAMVYKINDHNMKIYQYWKIPEYDDKYRNEDDLLTELEELIENSVRNQLIADVPVGILLSGGVDSSLITAFASRSVSKVKTFTIKFPNEKEFDESYHAKLISDYFGTEHYELEASTNSSELMTSLARQFDEPIVDSSIIPTFIVSQLIRKHCKVALGGDGGDELFGGYNHYPRLLKLEKYFSFLPRKLIRRPLANLAEFMLPLGFQGRNWLQALDINFSNEVPNISNYFDRKNRRIMMANGFTLPLTADSIRVNNLMKSSSILGRSMRADFQNYLQNDILVKVDRASMLNSLEIRAPFLDFRLIEFAFKMVPDELKVRENGAKKILLKKLCNKLLPPEFDQKRKRGFEIPLNKWLANSDWKELISVNLIDNKDSIFNKRFISNLINNTSKFRSTGERIFALLNFEMWRKEYNAYL